MSSSRTYHKRLKIVSSIDDLADAIANVESDASIRDQVEWLIENMWAKMASDSVLTKLKKLAPDGKRQTETAWNYKGGRVDHGRPSERIVPSKSPAYVPLSEGWVTDEGTWSDGFSGGFEVGSISGHMGFVLDGMDGKRVHPERKAVLAWWRSNETNAPIFTPFANLKDRPPNQFNIAAAKSAEPDLNKVTRMTAIAIVRAIWQEVDLKVGSAQEVASRG